MIAVGIAEYGSSATTNGNASNHCSLVAVIEAAVFVGIMFVRPPGAIDAIVPSSSGPACCKDKSGRAANYGEPMRCAALCLHEYAATQMAVPAEGRSRS